MEPTVGTRFAQAFAAKDEAMLQEVLAPEIDFRALTPGRFWEASSATEVIGAIMLGRWLEPSDQVDSLESVEEAVVVDRHRIIYRLLVHNADGPFVIEQVAYYDVADDRIGWLRVMCSGFRAAA